MKKITALTALIFVLFIQNGIGQDTSTFFAKADTFFKTYVKKGRVDYKGIKKIQQL